MIFKTFSFISMVLFTLFVLWALGWMWFATTVALAKPESVDVKTDAIVVLTGGNGRINEGLDLLAASAAPKLFISGVNEDVYKDDIYKSWKKSTRKKPCCIYLGYEAKDTVGNAIETKKWVDENNIKSIRLVTSTYHMPRAYQDVAKIVPDTTIIQHAMSADEFEPWRGRFWELTFSEYNKMLFRWFSHVGNSAESSTDK